MLKRGAGWWAAATFGTAAGLWLAPDWWRVLVGLAALGVVVAPRLPWPRRVPAASRRGLLLVVLAVAATAQATAVDLWSFASTPTVRVWNVYHYFLGAKYFPELGYKDLYVATLAARGELLASRPDDSRPGDLREGTEPPGRGCLPAARAFHRGPVAVVFPRRRGFGTAAFSP